MTIISIINHKGGVGKSTVALNLAYAFTQQVKTGLYDVDLQGSVTHSEVNEGLNVIEPVANFEFLKALKLDILIVDTPPYNISILPEILRVSDLVIVPTKSSAFDVLELASTLEIIKTAQRKNRNLRASILFSMVKHNSSLSNEMSEIIDELGFPVLQTRIINRVSYERSLLSGGIFSSEDENAKTEFANLCDEIMSIL